VLAEEGLISAIGYDSFRWRAFRFTSATVSFSPS
jgi:hypothetical protein